MNRSEFDQLVESLEARFKDRPRILTRSAVAWAVLGYSVLIAGLVGSLALAVASAWAIYTAPNALTLKLGLVFGLSGLVIAYSILRGAWIRLTPPEGETLNRGEVPELFEMIDSTAAKAGGIQFNRVILTDDLNASVVQVPLLGIFGWHRNYLTLGLQLMDALSPEEFHAVLAHEFAHLSKSHGRTGNWIYRIRSSWENVATSLAQQGGLLVKPLNAFFGWFWPRFNARAFVLSRANEYEADAFSAAATSPATAARALQRIAVEGQRLDEDFWEKIGDRAKKEATPPATIFQEISTLLKTRVEPVNCLRWLNQRLAMTTDTADTHPGLRDRIAALGIPPESSSLEPILENASDSLLGHDFSASTRERFSLLWLAANQDRWKESYEEAGKNREALKALESAPPTDENSWEILRLKCVLDGVPAMRAPLEEWIACHPDHQFSRFILGAHLISTDDPAGVKMLEAVAEASPASTYDCYGLLSGYYDRRGDAEAIRDLKRRADQHDARMNRAMNERNNLTTRDALEPHGLDPGKIAGHCKFLSQHSEIREAWLVRKQTTEFSHWPHFVLVVKLKFPALKFASDSTTATLLQTLADGIDMDGYLLVVNDEGANKSVTKLIKKLPGSKIYTKE